MQKNHAVLVVASDLVTLAIERPIDPLELIQIIKSFSDFCKPSAKQLLGLRMFVHAHSFVFFQQLHSPGQTVDRLIDIFAGIARQCKDFHRPGLDLDKSVEVFGAVDIGEVLTTDSLVNEGPVRNASELSAIAKHEEVSLILTQRAFDRLERRYRNLFTARNFRSSASSWEAFVLENFDSTA